MIDWNVGKGRIEAGGKSLEWATFGPPLQPPSAASNKPMTQPRMPVEDMCDSFRQPLPFPGQ